MDRIRFPSYDSLVNSESSLVKLYPNIDFSMFKTMHYLQSMSSFFGFAFFSFYLVILLAHGKTFLVVEHSFWFIFIFQILTFGSALVTQKISFLVNNVEYFSYDAFVSFPTFMVAVCDKITQCQVPMYWIVLTAFLIVQIIEFSNQSVHTIKSAHIYLIPVVLVVMLISLNTPKHMEIVMIVVCFLIWWIYRKHMVARLYSQETSRKDVLNIRRMNIWVSSQIFATLMYHLLKFAITQTIKSSVHDNARQIYYMFWKDEVCKGIEMFATYLNAMLFAWSTIHFIKLDKASSGEQSGLPVFVGSPIRLESFSRRPSAISSFSANNVAPVTPTDPRMLHI